jgi:mannose-6-phosphate isomerase-like protein (cupin superfamily)
MGLLIKPKVNAGCEVPKGGGSELIIENNEKYCGKLLRFKKGCKFSMHYHMIKDESWYVYEGSFIYKWIDTTNADLHEVHLKKGDVVRQIPGQPHQIIAETDGVIFEVSTHHEDDDSYRVAKGDSQK